MVLAVVFSCPSAILLHSSLRSSSSCRMREPPIRVHLRSSPGRVPFLGLDAGSLIPHQQRTRTQGNGFKEAGPEVEIVQDEEWEKRMRRDTAERDVERQRESEEELVKENNYRGFVEQLKSFPPQEVKQARKFVANLIKAGEDVEKMIEEAGESGELTPLVLLVIEKRLELARHDEEKYAIQALDLLYRRVETELFAREASPAMMLLNELLHLNDGFSKEEWLKQSRQIMLQVFPPEDAFTILGGSGFDLSKQEGPIGMPEEDDEILLRVDFIREVDQFIRKLKALPVIEPLQGNDAESVGIRLQQEERLRAIQQVKDLLELAARLKW